MDVSGSVGRRQHQHTWTTTATRRRGCTLAGRFQTTDDVHVEVIDGTSGTTASRLSVSDRESDAKRRAHFYHGLLATALAVLSSCGDSTQESPPLVWSGKHIDYHTMGPPPCAGTPAYLDRHIERTADLSGVQIEGRIPYIWHQNTSVLQGADREYLGLTTEDGVIHSVYSHHIHETVHAVINREYAGALPFREGLAELFNVVHETSRLSDIDPDRSPDVLSGNTQAHHSVWAYFMHYLIESHGLLPVLDLVYETRRTDDQEEYARTFAEIFPVHLDHALQKWADYPDCSTSQVRLAILECSEEPVHPTTGSPWLGDRWEFSTSFDCEDHQTLGPMLGSVWTYRTIDVARNNIAMISIQRGAQPGARLRITRCAPCGQSHMIEINPLNEDPTMTLEFLPAGRYYVEMFQPVEVSLTTEVEIQLVYEG